MNSDNEEEQVYIHCQVCLIDGKEFFGLPTGHVCTQDATSPFPFSNFLLSFLQVSLRCSNTCLCDSSQQKKGRVVNVSSSEQMPLSFTSSNFEMISISQSPGVSLLNRIPSYLRTTPSGMTLRKSLTLLDIFLTKYFLEELLLWLFCKSITITYHPSLYQKTRNSWISFQPQQS